MDSPSQSTPDLKWERLARVGRGRATILWLVRNTVTKQIQLWKWIHTRTCDLPGEDVVLDFLQGHNDIQKVFHWDEFNQVMVLKFANGGDMHSYTLDHYGATRQPMPEIFLWHFLRSMAASLAYCQAGWKDGDPFVAKEGWRPIIHEDLVTGDILLHWHKHKVLPQLILSGFGNAKFLDEMPPFEFDYLLRIMRARDPTASHLKRDLQDLGNNFQSMLVAHLFGGNAAKMQEDHNVTLAFDFARKQIVPAFSSELAEWVEKLSYNEFTDQSTNFANALEFAKELIPVADVKIAGLLKSAANLPGRPSTIIDDNGGSTSFLAPLHKDVQAFIKYYGDEGWEGSLGLKERHRQGEVDPQFEEYRAAHVEDLRKKERPYFIMPPPVMRCSDPSDAQQCEDEHEHRGHGDNDDIVTDSQGD